MKNIKNKYYIEKISEILSRCQARNINPDGELDNLIEDIYWRGANEQNLIYWGVSDNNEI